jgi:hypothetical protein
MDQEKILEILKDYKNKPNKDLLDCINFLNDDFYKTKELIINLTKRLDATEINYNKLTNELDKRTKNNIL